MRVLYGAIQYTPKIYCSFVVLAATLYSNDILDLSLT